MNVDYLKDSARLIAQFSDETIREYEIKEALLVSKINSVMDARDDVAELVGEKNVSMMHDNHSNHVKFIFSMLKNFDAEILTETVIWVFRSYCSHGFTTNYWSVQLNSWDAILKETLSEKTYKEIYPLYHWMIINIPIFTKIASEQLGESLDCITHE